MINEFLMDGDSTIQDCVIKLRTNEKGVVFIVGANQKLLGSLTHSDITKLILNDIPLISPAKKYMSKEVKFIRQSELEDQRALINKINVYKYYSFYPVVDENLHVLKIMHYSDIANNSRALIFDEDHVGKEKILVVGGAGYIGSVVTDYLLGKNFKVVVADKLLYGNESLNKFRNNPNFEFMEFDIRNISNIIASVRDIDQVVYLAELVGDPVTHLSPKATIETNFLSVLTFANLCKYAKINNFVYASSCSVYGASSEKKVNEESALNPVSLYAQMKILCENMLLDLARNSDSFKPVILRFATVFGLSYRPRFDLIVNKFVGDALKNEKITVFGGKQWRPFVHTKDLARAIFLALKSPVDETTRGRIYNVGDSRLNFTIDEIAEWTKKIIPQVKIIHKKDNDDNRSYSVDFKKIKNELGFQATMMLEDGIIELKEFMENNNIDVDSSIYSNVKTMQEKINNGKIADAS